MWGSPGRFKIGRLLGGPHAAAGRCIHQPAGQLSAMLNRYQLSRTRNPFLFFLASHAFHVIFVCSCRPPRVPLCLQVGNFYFLAETVACKTFERLRTFRTALEYEQKKSFVYSVQFFTPCPCFSPCVFPFNAPPPSSPRKSLVSVACTRISASLACHQTQSGIRLLTAPVPLQVGLAITAKPG